MLFLKICTPYLAVVTSPPNMGFFRPVKFDLYWVKKKSPLPNYQWKIWRFEISIVKSLHSEYVWDQSVTHLGTVGLKSNRAIRKYKHIV